MNDMHGFELDRFYSLFTKETEEGGLGGEEVKSTEAGKDDCVCVGVCVCVCVCVCVKVSDMNVWSSLACFSLLLIKNSELQKGDRFSSAGLKVLH